MGRWCLDQRPLTLSFLYGRLLTRITSSSRYHLQFECVFGSMISGYWQGVLLTRLTSPQPPNTISSFNVFSMRMTCRSETTDTVVTVVVLTPAITLVGRSRMFVLSTLPRQNYFQPWLSSWHVKHNCWAPYSLSAKANRMAELPVTQPFVCMTVMYTCGWRKRAALLSSDIGLTSVTNKQRREVGISAQSLVKRKPWTSEKKADEMSHKMKWTDLTA